MATLLPRQHYTVHDLDAMPEDGVRREIINGELFVTPAPRLWHQAAMRELLAHLRPYVRASALRLLAAPTAVRAGEHTQVEPDVIVFSRAAPFDSAARWIDIPHVILAVEILSPSTRRVDLTIKRTLYQSSGIAEYWIVDIDARNVRVYTQGSAAPAVHTAMLRWRATADQSPLELDLSEFFDEVCG
jgi:Uma2 family endonuclease